LSRFSTTGGAELSKKRDIKKQNKKKDFPKLSKDNPASLSWKEILIRCNNGNKNTMFGTIQGV